MAVVPVGATAVAGYLDAQLAGEARKPKRDAPLAVLLAKDMAATKRSIRTACRRNRLKG